MLENVYYGEEDTYYEERIIWSTSKKADFTEGTFDNMLINIPMFLYMTELELDEITWDKLIIQVPDPSDTALIDELAAAFEKSVGNGVGIIKSYVQKSSMDDAVDILNVIFSSTISVMMFLCFFSLTASMSGNLYDQAKEIGMMRAIGVTKGRIRMLYFYEAMILVFASCLLGVFVGTTIGFTMVLQQNLFLNSTALFFFPVKQVLLILGLSILCAFFSTFGPASQLVAKPVAAIFRTM